MIEAGPLIAFVGAAVLLLVVPGPVTVYILARGMEQGRRGAMVAVLGIQAGEVLHIFVGAIGVGALIASSPFAFTVVTYAGAAYMLGIGVQALITRENHAHDVVPSNRSLWPTFVHSMMINVLTPHTTLFYLAFLPAFVDPARGSASMQFLTLGLVFMLLGLIIEGGFAVLAGSIRSGLSESVRNMAAFRWATGGIYILIGVVLVGNGVT
ncbi:MAG: LysE family translocator [Chloroflexia bacterium]|nr:LysE family translocator [Chloroflexia bacterium]